MHSAIRLICGLATTKVISLFVGPVGLAYFGQFQGLMSLAYNFSNAGITNGVIRHVAQYSAEPRALARVLRTASLITIASTIAIALMLVLASSFLAQIVLHDAGYRWAVMAVGVLLVFASASLSLAALLNGQGRPLSYFATQVASSVLVLALVGALVPHFSLYGALLALPIAQIGVFLLTVGLCLREPSLLKGNWVPAWDRDMAGRLLTYSAAALLTAIAVAGSQLRVREIIISTVSAESAGYWQASLRISEALMITITSVLTSYYLPRLSATKKEAIPAEVTHFLVVVIPLFAFALGTLYLLRRWVIEVLFTTAFAPAERLFAAQFFGDLVRMSGWIFSTVLVARGRMKSVMASEICFGAGFVAFAEAFVPRLGELGGNIAYIGAALVSLGVNFLSFVRLRREGDRYTSA